MSSYEKNKISQIKTNTSNTNNSNIGAINIPQQKTSLFDEDRDMLQSIVAGEEKPRKSAYCTSDLSMLGKLGKHIG